MITLNKKKSSVIKVQELERANRKQHKVITEFDPPIYVSADQLSGRNPLIPQFEGRNLFLHVIPQDHWNRNSKRLPQESLRVPARTPTPRKVDHPLLPQEQPHTIPQDRLHPARWNTLSIQGVYVITTQSQGKQLSSHKQSQIL
jgi:hypothetical protein